MSKVALTPRQLLGNVLALGWLGLVGLTGLLAGYLPLPYGPGVPDLQQVAAGVGTPGHPLGTDTLGRDVLTGLVYGARELLLTSGPATVLAVVAGALMGGAAGYWGNTRLRVRWPVLLVVLGGLWWLARPPWPLGLALGAGVLLWAARRGRTLRVPLDTWVVGLTSLLGSVPRLLLLLALFGGTTLGSGGVALGLAVLTWPDVARVVRAEMQHVRELPYVEAARALGLSERRVWWRHALPAACYSLASLAPLLLATLVGISNTLSFLGISQGTQAANWGQLLSQYAQDTSAWWLIALPGGALLLTLLALQQLAWLGTRRQTRQ